MWAIPTGTSSVFLKKKQVMSPSPESRVPETGSDPPIGLDLDSGLETGCKTIYCDSLICSLSGLNLYLWEYKQFL